MLVLKGIFGGSLKITSGNKNNFLRVLRTSEKGLDMSLRGKRPLIQETGGILFREYCFGEENSLSLTEFYSKLGESCEKLGEFALAHK